MKNYLEIGIVIVFFQTEANSFSQNLVPNSSFEIYDTCPDGLSQIYNASPWFQPNNYGSSTDFYVPCTTDISAGVPSNFAGFQYANTGIGYCGFSAFFGHPQGTKGREYLEVKLNDTLCSGKKYCIQFSVSLSDNSGKAIDAIGVYFSVDSALYSSADYSNITFSPQVVNSAWNIISDTAKWVNITGEYIAAGGERFITIGNFYPDSLTNVYTSNPMGIAYYYIDDVSVMLCDDTCKETPPVAKFNYSDTGLTAKFNNLSTATSNNWLWYFGDGTSDTLQNPVHIYDSAGTFTVTLIACDSNCCNTFEGQVVVSEVGEGELGKYENLFRIYPNPANGKFTIQSNQPQGDNQQIIIFNFLGEEVYHSSFSNLSRLIGILNSSFNIDLSNEADGIYYFFFYDNGGVIASEKLVLAR